MGYSKRDVITLLSSSSILLSGCTFFQQKPDNEHELLVANLSDKRYNINIKVFNIQDEKIFSNQYRLKSEKVDDTKSIQGNPDRIIVEWGKNKKTIDYNPDIPCSGTDRNINLVLYIDKNHDVNITYGCS